VHGLPWQREKQVSADYGLEKAREGGNQQIVRLQIRQSHEFRRRKGQKNQLVEQKSLTRDK